LKAYLYSWQKQNKPDANSVGLVLLKINLLRKEATH
jgi:hypothetical protein